MDSKGGLDEVYIIVFGVNNGSDNSSYIKDWVVKQQNKKKLILLKTGDQSV